MRIAGFVASCSNAEINQITIGARGDQVMKEETPYFPFKLTISGSCQPTVGPWTSERKSFEGEGEYYIWKDAYGEWKAIYSRYIAL